MRGRSLVLRMALLTFVVGVLVVGCGSNATGTPSLITTVRPASPASSTKPTQPPAPTQSPKPTQSPSASVLPFPDLSEVELAPGRYDSSPPFDFPFTFEIPDVGWQSAHLHGEFFDVMRFDNPADPRDPTRWIAWAHPAVIYGEDSESQPAAGLAAQEAADLIATSPSLEVGPVSAFSFAGLEGVSLDLHSNLPNTKVFGGPDGDFGLDSSHDLRLGVVKVESEMLLVLCLTPLAELDEGCSAASPILDSVEF